MKSARYLLFWIIFGQDALTSSAFAIAIAPWSPMLLLYNLQKASRSGGFFLSKSEQVVRGWSGDGQEGFVRKRAHLKTVTEAVLTKKYPK